MPLGAANRVYVGTVSGVFRSDDGAASWNSTGPLPGSTVWALAATSGGSNVVYAGLEGFGVYKSDDAGASWQPRNNGMGNVRIRALAIDPQNPQVLYAGRDDGGGVYRSLDGGLSWAPFNTGLGDFRVKSLLVSGGSCHTLYAGTMDGVWYYGP
jgi:photosystem II stability/assembly factor-like uncharacterized protein